MPSHRPEHQLEKRGIGSLLRIPFLYTALQNTISPASSRHLLASSHYDDLLHSDGRILDFGCGPARLLAIFPQIDARRYVGVDTNYRYISRASRAHPRATFVHLNSDSAHLRLQAATFDFAVLAGVLHHLPDEVALSSLRTIRTALVEGGQLITIDPTWHSHWISRALMKRDRGQFIRTEQGYRDLIQSEFRDGDCRTQVRTDLLRLPYAHCLTKTLNGSC